MATLSRFSVQECAQAWQRETPATHELLFNKAKWHIVQLFAGFSEVLCLFVEFGAWEPSWHVLH
jgi:hypothetical protein